MTISQDLSKPNNRLSSAPRKRLVLFVKAFPLHAEAIIIQKFLGLLEQGWDVHIVCSRSTKEWQLFPQLAARNELHHRVHVAWLARPPLLEALLYPLSFLRCLLLAPKSSLQYLGRGWRHFGPYILHLFYMDAELIILHPDLVQYEYGYLAFGRMHVKEFLDCRITVSFQGSDLNSTGLDKPDYYHQVWEQADAIQLVGEDLWNRAQQRGCPSEKPHAVISPGIDTSFFTPGTRKKSETVGIPTRPYRILGVGRLVWKKGYEYALQAVKELVDRGISCEYRIVGIGPYADAIAFTTNDLGLENVVSLLGQKSRSEVKEQLEWADVFFHASVSEGFCIAVMEAQAMALPVVCTDAGDVGIENEETGFAVSRRDWHAMAEKLAVLAVNPELRTQMGEAGRQRALEKFQLAGQITGFERFYLKVLSNS
jgi:colanic acid/amylovoran biosynthesis glycosyltransferase